MLSRDNLEPSLENETTKGSHQIGSEIRDNNRELVGSLEMMTDNKQSRSFLLVVRVPLKIVILFTFRLEEIIQCRIQLTLSK